MNKPHKCYGCGEPVETFVKVKRKVYRVKVYQCVPECFGVKIMNYYQERYLNECNGANQLMKAFENSLLKFSSAPDFPSKGKEVVLMNRWSKEKI